MIETKRQFLFIYSYTSEYSDVNNYANGKTFLFHV